MRHACRIALPLLLILLTLGTTLISAPPRIERGQLQVNDKPYLILGGELSNSAASNAEYLRQYWPKLRALNLNTVLVPIWWEQLEPTEGKYDFALLEKIIADARAHDMRLVLLWFGSWKNSMSSHAPAWVKKDQTRFPRATDAQGRSQEILTPFSTANRDADARAFAALMRRLKEIDSDKNTVLMVQVENEIGMIPDARDHCAAATAAYKAAVPAELLAYLTQHEPTLAPELHAAWQAAGSKHNGTWTEVFGDNIATEEIFMAWHFARYTEAITAAGRAEYALPMFTNAALIRPGYLPGQYPSAGPLPHLIDIWRAGAPTLDFLSPDIYFPNFVEWTRRYTRTANNPLFIPEALRSPDASVNALYAFAQHDAIGFCPFGIETINEPAATYLKTSYDILRQLTPLLITHHGRGNMAGLLQESPEQKRPQQLRLNGYAIEATFENVQLSSLADGVINETGAAAQTTRVPAGGLVIALGPDEFLFAGIGVTVTFRTLLPDTQAGILSIEEGRYDEQGRWQNIRWLNGDQTHQGRHLRLEPGRFTLQRIKLYHYK